MSLGLATAVSFDDNKAVAGGGDPPDPDPDPSNWILREGTWHDGGVWVDSETWMD